jgi:hypothetical protein
MIYIGIDPGVSGGIATIDEKGRVLGVEKLPELEHEILAALTKFIEPGQAQSPRRAMLERVIPFSRPGAKIGVVSSFTSGKGYGKLLMALTATFTPFDEVMPQKWQAALGCRSGGNKNVTKRRALQLWPTMKITHAYADALLLAEYCRRVDQGKL